jgi:hypothetical protein
VISIELFPTKSTVDRQVTSAPDRNRLVKIQPVDGLGDRGPAGMPDGRHRGGLIHQRHQVAAEQVPQHVLHVGHHEGRDLALRERHRARLWYHAWDSSSERGS